MTPPSHPSNVTDTLNGLAQQLDQFASERNWKQFHSPKNLASALSVEAGELGIDPVAAAHVKLKLNVVKYPVDLARGNSKKYANSR